MLLALQLVFRAGDAALPILMAAWFGRSDATDVYVFAWAAFALAGSVVFAVYQDSAIVPILTEVRLRSPTELGRVVGSLVMHTLVFGGALAAGIGVAALGFFALRYEGESFALAARMVPLMSLVLVAMGLRTLLSAVLASHGVFAPASLASALGMATMLGLAALGHGRGIGVLPAAALAGEAVATLLLALLVRKLVDVRPTLARPEPVVRFFALGGSEAIGGALTRVNPLVDQMIAGVAGVVGGGTMLRYSGDVATAPSSLLAGSLLPVLLAHLSADAAERDFARVRRTVRRSLVVVALVLAAAAVGIHLVRRPLIELVFAHGEMDPAGVERLVRLVPYHVVGLAPFGALLVLAKAHVALKNSGIMIGMGALNAGLNVLFDVVLAKAIGLEGIALATSCVHAAIAVVFYVRLEARLGRLRRDARG